MNGLRGLLEDVADQARTYDVTERAVRAAHRRERLHRYAPLAAVAAVALLAVGIWVPLRPSGGEPSLVAGPVPWLPEVVAPPAQPPPVLGPDRRVGPGSLLYRVQGQAGTILLTSDGRRYTVPDRDDRRALSLSPDGRWLLLGSDDLLVIQDLRDGGQRQVAATDGRQLSWRWSSNGRWLALGETLVPPAERSMMRLIDLTTGQSTSSRAQPVERSMLAVLDSGEVLLWHAGTTSLSAEHPSGGARSVPLRLAGAMRPNEGLNPQPVAAQALADGANVLMRAWALLSGGDGRTALVPDDLLMLDPGNGTVLRRFELPDPVFRGPVGGPPSVDPSAGTQTSGTPSEPPLGWTDAAYDKRDSVAVAPEGVLLVHEMLSGSVELELLDTRTGELTVVTRAGDRVGDLRPRGYTR
ncbi:hypothetical protein ACTMTJ_16325 [Phytohabitans sp. LJ34]|uniref:hypothetical protein n=1 Tax=Phytohabitans sp. LJ34 TaxID=3452217 RepID=UPI003F891F66